MKNFTFIILAFLCIALTRNTSFAQVTSKGNFLIGGTLGFSTATSSVEQDSDAGSFEGEGAQATQFNIAPNIGYFVANNIAVGVGLDYTFNETREPIDFADPNTDFLESNDSDLLFGPFARFYLPLKANKFFFVETNLGFGSSSDEFETLNGRQTQSTNIFALGVGPGFSIVSGDAIGIEALVKYNYARSNSDLDIAGSLTETTAITNQLDFSIGLQFYFNRVR